MLELYHYEELITYICSIALFTGALLQVLRIEWYQQFKNMADNTLNRITTLQTQTIHQLVHTNLQQTDHTNARNLSTQ